MSQLVDAQPLFNPMEIFEQANRQALFARNHEFGQRLLLVTDDEEKTRMVEEFLRIEAQHRENEQMVRQQMESAQQLFGSQSFTKPVPAYVLPSPQAAAASAAAAGPEQIRGIKRPRLAPPPPPPAHVRQKETKTIPLVRPVRPYLPPPPPPPSSSSSSHAHKNLLPRAPIMDDAFLDALLLEPATTSTRRPSRPQLLPPPPPPMKPQFTYREALWRGVPGFEIEYDGHKESGPKQGWRPQPTREQLGTAGLVMTDEHVSQRQLIYMVMNRKIELVRAIIKTALEQYASGERVFPYAAHLTLGMTISDCVRQYSEWDLEKVIDGAISRGSCPCQNLIHALCLQLSGDTSQLSEEEQTTVQKNSHFYNQNLIAMAIFEEVVPFFRHTPFRGPQAFDMKLAERYMYERKRLRRREKEFSLPWPDEPVDQFNPSVALAQLANLYPQND